MIEDLEDIREEDPLLYEKLNRQSIRSLVVTPLYNDKKVMGFYGVDNPPKEMLDYTSDMLQIMGHFITSSLKRRNLVTMLQQMSYSDQLTGFGNRYAMNEHIDSIPDGESVGVVFCDVTGLKRVNDTQGHEAGDRLILRGCESLRRVFAGYELFRIGGDEFLTLCPGIEEEELKEKVLAIMPDGHTGAPCGACRELMVQLMPVTYKAIEIMLDYEQKKMITLGELTPEWWI